MSEQAKNYGDLDKKITAVRIERDRRSLDGNSVTVEYEDFADPERHKSMQDMARTIRARAPELGSTTSLAGTSPLQTIGIVSKGAGFFTVTLKYFKEAWSTDQLVLGGASENYSYSAGMISVPLLCAPFLKNIPEFERGILNDILNGHSPTERVNLVVPEELGAVQPIVGADADGKFAREDYLFNAASKLALEKIKKGVQEIRVPTVQFSVTKTVNKPEVDEDFGKISSPGPKAPALPGGRNWMKIAKNGTKGEDDTEWTETTTWESSDEGGWDSDLYTFRKEK